MLPARRRRETIVFTVATLLVSYAIGYAWLAQPGAWWLVQWLMTTPAIVGASCAWLYDREPPRAAGFAFTGWKPWALAFVYAPCVAACAASIGYAVRFATGNARFIYFQPEAVFGDGGIAPRATYLAAMLARVLGVWLAVAIFYRAKIDERLSRAWAPLAHVARIAAWAAVVWSYPGPLAPPGSIGEEIGWRGFLVRRWKDRRTTALIVGMPIWAAFHLPVVFAATQRGHLAQNVAFLVSIAAAAPVFAAFYLWSGSIWPCAILHFTWNLWNPLLLGDVYGGAAGVFGGEVWFFNGEGVGGLLVNGALSIALIVSASKRARRADAE